MIPCDALFYYKVSFAIFKTRLSYLQILKYLVFNFENFCFESSLIFYGFLGSTWNNFVKSFYLFALTICSDSDNLFA